MNERLRELMIEADYAAPELAGRAQKLAELIVRECARVVNDTEYPYENESDKNTWDTCCVWSAEKLKKHFGVE